MKQESQLIQLKSIADAAFEVDRAKLAGLNKREAALRQTLRDLDTARGERASGQRRPDEPAVIAGADLQWHLWIDQRRSMLNTELAQVLALKSRAMSQVQKSFGRQQSLDGLSDQVQRKHRMLLQRKLD